MNGISMFDKTIPRVTEYKGVVFRSKSEACLAKYFEDYRFLWSYEPKEFSVGNYTPDFSICFKATDGSLPRFIVEYKPSEPTMTYMEGRANDLRHLTERYMIPFVVLCGSFFESEDECQTKAYIFKIGSSDIAHTRNGWFSDNGRKEEGIRRSISKHRFDLKGSY